MLVEYTFCSKNLTFCIYYLGILRIFATKIG